MKESFEEHKFSDKSLAMLQVITNILEGYRKQGFKLSLRQLYYQLVARDYIPNTQRSYKNIGVLVSNGRLAGVLDWEMIEDRNRETVSLSHWEDPAEIVAAAARQFRIDMWANQPYHVEVMVEKDALSGVLEPVCNELDVSITANKGYSSSSTMYEIGKRLENKAIEGKEIVVLYLGDHDPSGIDMTRDVQERLTMLSCETSIEVIRVALNIDQVKEWRPPENPAKETDSRYLDYIRSFGRSSWELDAIEPAELAGLVRSIVREHLDQEQWDEDVERWKTMREELDLFVEAYNSKRRNGG
jgi:hypothetical protein